MNEFENIKTQQERARKRREKQLKQQTEKSDDKPFHSLKIKNKEVYLDNLRLKGVIDYEVKSSAKEPTELILKIMILDTELFAN